MCVGLFTILVLTQCLERSAERRGKVTEFVNLRISDEVNGSLCTDPSLGSWRTLYLRAFCGVVSSSRAWERSFLSLSICFTRFTPENGEGAFLGPKRSLLPAVHTCEWGGKREQISFFFDLAPTQCLDLSSCSGKQIES